MNFKRITMVGIAAAMTMMCTACGSSAEGTTAPAKEPVAIAEPAAEAKEASDAEPAANAEESTAAEEVVTPEQDTTDSAEKINKDSENEVTENNEENTDESSLDERHVTGSLPAYEYPGPELFYLVLYDYLKTNLIQSNYEDEVIIPCPIIVYEDESNNDDIRVYGDFRIYSYYLDGDIMKTSSGGSFPGCVHLKSTDAGYEVTEMELVEDGSTYTESAQKIFGEHYEEFSKTISDSDATEEIRAQIVANYVAANNLSVTAIQDYGWDPKQLPPENIDSFYSTLD